MDEVTQVETIVRIADLPSPRDQTTFQDEYSWYQLSTQLFTWADKKHYLDKLLDQGHFYQKNGIPIGDPGAILKSPMSFSSRPPYPLNRTPIDIECPDKDYKILLLEKILNDDPDEETAWVWLSMATEVTERKISYLKKVLQINPDNELAERAFKQLILEQNKKRFDVPPGTTPSSSTGLNIVWENIAVVAVIIVLILMVLSFGLIGWMIYKATQNNSLPFLAGIIADIMCV